MAPAQKVILITGASAGIGKHAAELLAAQGHLVFGTSRKPARAEENGVTFLTLDVTSPESVRACVENVLTRAGRLDVLINNAGIIGAAAASEEGGVEQVRVVFETNFFGVIAMINAVLPVMRAQKSGQIINISSAGGEMPVPPFFSAYTSSKHALEGYTEALASELRHLGIRVSSVQPGYFVTAIAGSIQAPARQIEDYAALRQHNALIDQYALQHGRGPRIVAQVVAKIVHARRPRLRYTTGLDVDLMFLIRSLFPHEVFQALINWMMLTPPLLTPGDDAATQARKLGLRRLFLDAGLLNRILGMAAALALAALALLTVSWALVR